MRFRTATLMLLAIVVLPSSARAQMRITELPARGALYVEMFGGSAMVVCCSLNLEIPVSDHVVIRAGTAKESGGEPPPQSVLFTAEKLIGSHGRYLEVGGGLVMSTVASAGNSVWRPGPTLSIGYRAYTSGWIRRYTFTPVLPPFAQAATPGSRGIVPMFGMSIGRTF